MSAGRTLPALGLLALVWALVGPALTAVDRTDRSLCMTVLDVGQGDALLLDLPGAVWLVDGGGAPGSRRDVGEDTVVPALRARGIDRLDRVVLTHGDADHIGGLFAVLEQLQVGELLVPTRQHLSSAERMLLNLARRQGVSILIADEGAELGPLPGGTHGALLHPSPGWEPADPGDRNARSVVFRIGLGGIDFLLTGDIEAETDRHLLDRGVLTPAAVLKLAHHGSRTSTTPELLGAVDPLLALTGAGQDNRFGFPHTSVVQRLRAHGTEMYWTGRHGALRVCTDGFAIELGPVVGEGPGFTPWIAPAEVVARWQSLVRTTTPAGGLASPPAVAGSDRQQPSTPRSRRASKTRKRKRSKAAAPKTTEPATPAPPTLLDDREWRSRRKSARMKAPWRSR